MVGKYFHSQFAYGGTDMKRRTVQHFQKYLALGGWHFPRFSEMLVLWGISGHQLECLIFMKLAFGKHLYCTKLEATLENIGLGDFFGLKASKGILDVAVISTSLLCATDCSLCFLFFRWWWCLPWAPSSPALSESFMWWSCVFESFILEFLFWITLNMSSRTDVVLFESLTGHLGVEERKKTQHSQREFVPMSGILLNFNSQLFSMLKVLI